MCGGSGEMPCVCQEEESWNTSKRKRNRKKEKEKEQMKRKNKTKAKKTNTNTKKQTRMLKTQTEIQHASCGTCPSWRNGPAVVSAWWNRSFFQRRVLEWLAGRLLVREIPFRERPGSGRQCSTTLCRSDLQKEESVWPPSQNSAQYERVIDLEL